MARRVNRGEIRMYRFSSPDKQRPVLIMTRQSATSYLHSVTVAPITSTIRGVPSEVTLDENDGLKRPCSVNLHHLVTVPKKTLGRRLGQLGSERMRQVCRAASFSLGCDG